MRHKSSGPFEGRIQGRAPPQRLCTVQEDRHRVREQRRAEARPQLLDLKAMFLSFQSYATSSCQKPSLWKQQASVADWLSKAFCWTFEGGGKKNLFFKQRPVIVSWWSPLAIGTKVRQTNKRTAVSISSKTPSSVLNRRRASRPAYSFSLLLLRWLESRSIRLTSRKKLWIFALCKCWRSGRGKPACDDRF